MAMGDPIMHRLSAGRQGVFRGLHCHCARSGTGGVFGVVGIAQNLAGDEERHVLMTVHKRAKSLAIPGDGAQDQVFVRDFAHAMAPLFSQVPVYMKRKSPAWLQIIFQ
jgi:hypothetical protein